MNGLKLVNMKVLVMCEESQEVCKAFRYNGHEAYSNDITKCSGGYPEWHLQMDCFEAFNLIKPDLIIAHPPCTRLTISANRWYKPEYKNRFPNIYIEREMAIDFFIKIYNLPVSKICIENPVGIMSTHFRKADQYIDPFQFGHPEKKKTGLWLKGLPLLRPTSIVLPEYAIKNNGEHFVDSKGFKDSPTHYQTLMIKDKELRSKLRSKTFSGIAKAMADQWTKPYHIQTNLFSTLSYTGTGTVCDP